MQVKFFEHSLKLLFHIVKLDEHYQCAVAAAISHNTYYIRRRVSAYCIPLCSVFYEIIGSLTYQDVLLFFMASIIYFSDWR